jgi:hypothetical protein
MLPVSGAALFVAYIFFEYDPLAHGFAPVP